MKLIIAGTRSFNLYKTFLFDFFDYFDFNAVPRTELEIVSGGCCGVDSTAIEFAKDINIKFKVFEADWKTHGKAAGPIRNKEMAQYADALLLIWDGESRGSRNMKEEMISLNKPVYEVILRGNNARPK